jgi:hypothetical protein
MMMIIRQALSMALVVKIMNGYLILVTAKGKKKKVGFGGHITRAMILSFPKRGGS